MRGGRAHLCVFLCVYVCIGPVDHQNAFFKRWDGMVMVALLFTASVTPFEVAFLTPGINTLFFLNRLVDLLFLVVCGMTLSPSPCHPVSLQVCPYVYYY